MSEPTLPAPLVPSEVDLSDFQYMELDVRLLRDSKFAAETEAEAFRAGVLLWCAAWHQVPAASLPNNDIELSNLAGYGRVVKEWRKVRDQALALFVLCSDGRLYHPGIAEVANRVWKSRQRDFSYQRFRAAVLERDGHACVYCGATGQPFHLDHVIPRSKGGADTISNLATACAPCNLSKAAKPLSEWGGR